MSKVVALDIGHGSDTFPPSKGIYKNGKAYPEHSFNAKLVPAIDKLLRQNGIDTIIYQKPNKPDVPLKQRTDHYNAKGVDLVYSIHANYNGDSSVNGRCVFYWHTSESAKKLADIVVDEIKKAGYSTHGNGLHASKKGSWTNLHICRETKMTAVLVENGFMSGDKDFDLVFGSKQSEYIKDMAEVHAKAICRYFGIKYNGEKSEPVKPSKPVASKPKPNKPSKPNTGDYKGNSVVDYLKHNKQDSSFSNRAKLAKKHGIKNYKGTPSQNTKLLNALRGKKSKPKTKNKYPLPNGVLKVGSRGNGVKQLQRALNAANFKVGKVDGIYGAKTKDGVTRFQSVHDAYNVDGVYGPRTKTRLDKVVN